MTAPGQTQPKRKLAQVSNDVDAIYEILGEIQTTVAGHTDQLIGIGNRLDGMDLRFDGIDARLDRMDLRFDGIDTRLGGIDRTLALILERLPAPAA